MAVFLVSRSSTRFAGVALAASVVSFDLLFALAPVRLPDAVRWAMLGFGVVSQLGFYLWSSRNRGMRSAANGAGRSGSSEHLEGSPPCEPTQTC